MNSLEIKILEIISNFPDILFCSLYGSGAKNKMTPKSDIDIAVAKNIPFSPEELVDISLKLSGICQREIDIVDIQKASGVILQEVLCNGKILLKKSPELYASLIRKMWYNQADVMPNIRLILNKRLKRIF